MQFNLYFEISAIIILSTLFIALMFRRVSVNRTNVLFDMLVLAVLFTAIIDVFEALTNDRITKCALDYAYFLIRNITPPIFILYICSFIGIWHRLKITKPLIYLTFVPYIVDVVLIASNPFTGAIFTIDENAVYSRGSLMYILYVGAFYYVFLSLFILIRNRKLVESRKNLILLIFQPMNIFTVLIQMLLPEFRVEIFGTAVLSVVMAVGVHKPEEYLNSVVGINTPAGFHKDIRNIIGAGRPSTILLIKDINYAVLKETLGYDLYSDLTRRLADKFKNMNSLTDSKADLYFLEKGTFAAVTSYSRYNMIYNFGRMLCDFVKAPFKLAGMEIMLDTRMCLINCPNDINDADAMIGFADALEYRIHETDKLVIMSDISESREFRMRNDMNSIIGRGISGHSFQMYYQPIYSLKEKRFTCAEALIRLIDEEYGFVRLRCSFRWLSRQERSIISEIMSLMPCAGLWPVTHIRSWGLTMWRSICRWLSVLNPIWPRSLRECLKSTVLSRLRSIWRSRRHLLIMIRLLLTGISTGCHPRASLFHWMTTAPAIPI